MREITREYLESLGFEEKKYINKNEKETIRLVKNIGFIELSFDGKGNQHTFEMNQYNPSFQNKVLTYVILQQVAKVSQEVLDFYNKHLK